MKSLTATVVVSLLILTPGLTHASWFSEITGIDVDLNRGSVQVKSPNLAAIPQMIQNLPKDIGQAMLNPAAPALATAIRFSRGQAINRGVQPIPANVKADLAPYFPAELLDKVRWTSAGGVSIDGALKNWLNQEGAVTLDDVVVFNGANVTGDIELWAHELTHVLQYSQLGVETFAFQYTVNFDGMEAQARQNASQIASSIKARRAGKDMTWGFQGQMASAESQASWNKVNAAARQAINPLDCIWINNQTNITGNRCPVQIRVSGVVLRRFDGYEFTFPCNESTCIFGPNKSGPLISPPGHLVIGVTAAYEF
jgi:Tfp pilus assembly protein FimT